MNTFFKPPWARLEWHYFLKLALNILTITEKSRGEHSGRLGRAEYLFELGLSVSVIYEIYIGGPESNSVPFSGSGFLVLYLQEVHQQSVNLVSGFQWFFGVLGF